MSKHPRAATQFRASGDDGKVRVWADSNRAGDSDSRQCSGGWIEFEGQQLAHWSTLQSNIVLASAEMALDTAFKKGISEIISLFELRGRLPDVTAFGVYGSA